MIFSQAPRKATPRPPNVREMCVYSPPGSVPSGVERNTEYPTEVARIGKSRAAWARITLGPVGPRIRSSP
jgi:hypothetical protein